jgi:hypothetical protein
MTQHVEQSCFLKRSCGERGITTVVVLLVLLVLTLIAIAGMAVSTTEIRIAGNQYRSVQALHAADAGWREQAINQVTIIEDNSYNPGLPAFQNPPFQFIPGPAGNVNSPDLPAGPGQASGFRIPQNSIQPILGIDGFPFLAEAPLGAGMELGAPGGGGSVFRRAIFNVVSQGREPSTPDLFTRTIVVEFYSKYFVVAPYQ